MPMVHLPQKDTGDLTEFRVKQKLESFGLKAIKASPDNGVDLEVTNPETGKIARVQVKGRNPKKVTTYRWFQLRVPKRQLERARDNGIDADQTWQDKVRKVDFFVLDAVKVNEMWVLTKEQTFELIRLNEVKYHNRPDNVFVYDNPIKGKQKEMDMEVPGVMEKFASCKNNFQPLLEFLGVKS
jgi:hypothetical protein